MSRSDHTLPNRLVIRGFIGLIALTVTVASRALLPAGTDPAAASLTASIYACCALLMLPLLLCVAAGRHDRHWPASSVLVTALLAVILVMDPLTRNAAPQIPQLLVTMLLMSASVSLVCVRVSGSLVFPALILLTLAPVWAGPGVEATGNPAWLTSLVVGISPMTALAVSVDLDYLRTSWFYANSPLGSLRYDYPEMTHIWLCLSLLPAAALLRRLLDGTSFLRIRHTREAHP